MDIEIDNVSHSYRPNGRVLSVLDNIDLSVPSGQRIAFLGPSGCGKTTLLRLIGGLISPTKGSVLVDGLPPNRLHGTQRIGFSFQGKSLLPWRTVTQNIMIGSELRSSPLTKKEAEANCTRLLDLVDLAPFKDALPSVLSGGMLQRVALARALFTRPDLLLLDEPLASLDLLTRESLLDEIERIISTSAATSVLVTHSAREACFLCDRICLLSKRPAKLMEVISYDVAHPRPPELLESASFAKVVSACRRRLVKSKGPAHA